MNEEITAISLLSDLIDRRQRRLDGMRDEYSGFGRKVADVRSTLDDLERDMNNLNHFARFGRAVDSLNYELEEGATLAREILELKRALDVLKRHEGEGA